jgi:DNA-binding transcriptional MerR regulator
MKDEVHDAPILIPSEAGRVLGVTAAGVRYLERIGQLRPLRSEGGFRIYLRTDVERLAHERSERPERGKR